MAGAWLLAGCTITQYVNCLPPQPAEMQRNGGISGIPSGFGEGAGTLSGTVTCPDGTGATASMAGQGGGEVSP